MNAQQHIVFGPFRLDLANEQLWCGAQAMALKPKALAVLRYLAAHPGQLVTKEDLLEALWAEVYVGDAVLKTCMREIRQALGDKPRTPQYIETVHRRGYRFIAAVSSQLADFSSFPSPPTLPRLSPQSSWLSPIDLVGREAELAQLQGYLEQARSGDRRIIFVTGEAGIGKTTLVEAFLDQIASREEMWIGRGQCIEQYGAGEAYLPVLEALGRLCREPGGERLVELLHQHAPTWLVQMPALLAPTELETLQGKVLGATQERMLREMAEAIEALTHERLLVLRFEDLHWSDPSTLNLLAYLARRPGPARLLVLGTYRPVDVIVGEHPLKTVKQELQLHGQCEELRLEFLTEAAVEEYLTRRFGVGAQRDGTQDLVQMLHQRTEGNPLFMVNVVNELVAQGVLTQRDGQWELVGEIAATDVPAGLQQFIEQQIERGSPEQQQVLEAASVAGMDFSAAAVAAALEEGIEGVEKCCEELSRQEQFMHASGVSEWPDGTVAARYSFLHALFRETLYERVPAGQRLRLHRRIGERLETAYGGRAREIAAELALHFEQGRDTQRALQYLQQAGENAVQHSAHQEAIRLLTRGLALLQTAPETPERTQQELGLQLVLGASQSTVNGWGAPEVEHTYVRARALCQQLGETPQLFLVLAGLHSCYCTRGELMKAHDLAEQLAQLAQALQFDVLIWHASNALGITLSFMGELRAARHHLEQQLAFYPPQQSGAISGFPDPEVARLSRLAAVLGLLGYPDQALSCSEEVLARAQELDHPFSLAYALFGVAEIHWHYGELHALQEDSKALLALSREQGFAHFLALGTISWGIALSEQEQNEEGIAQIRQGLAGYRATGAGIGQTYILFSLAAAYRRAWQVEAGLATVAEALDVVDNTGERWIETELYRLKGELTLNDERGMMNDERRTKQAVQAEACFQQAIEIARRQEAKSLELRAVMSLSRLWQKQGKKAEARQMLTEIYVWFTEGFDTKDLKEAKALLEQLT